MNFMCSDSTRISRRSSLTLPLFHKFSLTFSNGSGASFCIVLAPILAPNWHQKSSKIRPKSHAQGAIRFRSVFKWIFNEFWCQVGAHLGPQVAPKIVQNPSQEPFKTHPNGRSVSDRFLKRFLMNFGAKLGPRNH